MPILCDAAVFSLIGLSGFRPRIGVRGKLFAGMKEGALAMLIAT